MEYFYTAAFTLLGLLRIYFKKEMPKSFVKERFLSFLQTFAASLQFYFYSVNYLNEEEKNNSTLKKLHYSKREVHQLK